jgi:uncharacterized protein YjhX (UPF0386 family)
MCDVLLISKVQFERSIVVFSNPGNSRIASASSDAVGCISILSKLCCVDNHAHSHGVHVACFAADRRIARVYCVERNEYEYADADADTLHSRKRTIHLACAEQRRPTVNSRNTPSAFSILLQQSRLFQDAAYVTPLRYDNERRLAAATAAASLSVH